MPPIKSKSQHKKEKKMIDDIWNGDVRKNKKRSKIRPEFIDWIKQISDTTKYSNL